MLPRIHKIVILSVVFFLLTFKIDRIPGMHGDEGWSILLSHAIMEGHRPFINMNRYTGTLFQFLAVPAFELFGFSLWTLRGISAVFNLGAIALLMGAIESFSRTSRAGTSPGESGISGLGIRLGWLAGTLPIFVIMSRFSAEVTALGPLLNAAALYLLASAALGAAASSLLAGALLALASYNHILNLTFVGALVLAVALTWGKAALRDIRVRLTFLGFSVLYFPALTLAFRQPEMMAGVSTGRLHSILALSFLDDFLHLPIALREMWDGRPLYMQTAGENLLPIVPYATLLALFLMGIAAFSWVRKTPRPVPDPRTRFLAALVVSDIVLTGIASPMLIERYFELSLLLFVCFLVWITRNIRWKATAAILLFAGANVFYLGSNYFYAYSRSGGKLACFSLGSRGMEASNYFLDKEPLIAQLKKNNIVTVATDFITHNALRASQIDRAGFEVVSVSDFSHPTFPNPPRRKAAIVTYNGPNPIDIKVISPPRAPAIRDFSGQLFRLEPTYDQRFLVYVNDGI